MRLIGHNAGRIGLIAFLAGALVLHGASLTIYPSPTCDESSYGSNADSVIRYGNFGQSMLARGDPYGRDVNSIQMGRLYAVALAAWFEAAGVNLAAGRLFSLLGWIAAVGMTYLLGRRLYDARFGLAAALLFATLPIGFYASHILRPEGWTSAAVTFVLWLAAGHLREPAGRLRPVLVGLACALPLEIHANGLWFLITAGFVVTAVVGFGRKRWSWVVLFAFGAGMGLALWAALHLWPDPMLAWRQATSSYDVVEKAAWKLPLTVTLARAAGWIYEAFWQFAGPLSILQSALFFLGIAAAVRRRRWPDRLLIAWQMISMLLFLLLLNHRPVFYAVLWLPGYCLLAVVGLHDLVKAISRPIDRLPAQWLWSGAIVSLIGINLAANAWLAYRYRGAGYLAEGRALVSMTKAGSTVMGDSVWWWAFRPTNTYLDDGLLYVDLYVAHLGRASSASDVDIAQSLAGSLRRLHPDYVLVDDALSCFVDDRINPELIKLLDARCILAGRIDGAWIGDPDKHNLQFGQTTSVYQCT